MTMSPQRLRGGVRSVRHPKNGVVIVASRMNHNSARKHARKGVRADSVALTCELILHGSPP